MQLEPDEAQQNPAVAAFIAELRHWREVTGYSQKALARLVGYTPSYVSKVERGTVAASRRFAESADQQRSPQVTPGTPLNTRTLQQPGDSPGDKRNFKLFKKTHP
ncbi:MAG TPA: helix-turn-helix transcriptional regulator [Streptosporangiaceae bacterium]|nr:helix-turn-helix transcriptional regulator [Streptosporangiaceae bacterium]